MRLKSGRVVVSALVAIGAFAVIVGPSQLGMQSPTVAAQAGGSMAQAVLRTASGAEVGRATFTDEDGHVMVNVTASGLTPGFHGFHVHNVAQCDGPDFTSAGAHFSPMPMSQPMHAGDLPSLLVNQDGTAALQTATDRFSIDDLLGGAGTAVIVHANPDNFANIPPRYTPAPDATTLGTGDAGARVACGVVQAGAEPMNGGGGASN